MALFDQYIKLNPAPVFSQVEVQEQHCAIYVR